MKPLIYWMVALSTLSGPQTTGFFGSRAPEEPLVTGAPYSAEAITTMKLVLFDGGRIERKITAIVHRDSSGRIRREQTVAGLDPLDPTSGGSVSVVTIFDPVAAVIYSLIPGSRTAHRLPLDKATLQVAGAPTKVEVPPGMPSPPPTKQETLGTRQIEGLTATGRRTVMTFPAGAIGNDRPIEVFDEFWESVDLKVLLESRHHNPQTGDVTYRLTNIRRAEPARDLFTVPAGYKIMEPTLPHK